MAMKIRRQKASDKDNVTKKRRQINGYEDLGDYEMVLKTRGQITVAKKTPTKIWVVRN